ncbi:hypothetical protein NJ17_004541 [Salmonella enterica subsp. enterica]|nr:hypothetical protein [Salmonella enterica]EDN7225680.1 hypothetical protein [Salmonella enterica subsp. enterica]EDV2766115.1 hypothetical protein [Salmonella enterica subsp. enterica serovar Soahanina]EDV9255282.1 hypothetical protein [Salmonella enterica subsp. enterica serovar Sundsvall]EBN6679052.1 hypothetical protein [Salmonella enterica]
MRYSGDDGLKGCLGDSDCVKQVAEMRPFFSVIDVTNGKQFTKRLDLFGLPCHSWLTNLPTVKH